MGLVFVLDVTFWYQKDDYKGWVYGVERKYSVHKSTIDLSTGKTLLTFGYNADSQLATITTGVETRQRYREIPPVCSHP